MFTEEVKYELQLLYVRKCISFLEMERKRWIKA